MKPLTTMRAALKDPKLLGGVMRAKSWAGWKVLLIAAAGEALNAEERATFRRLTSRDHEPGRMVKEFVGALGRRSGKSFSMSVFICWIAGLCDHRAVLAPGETGVALLISRDQRVAKVILNYIDGILKSSEVLRTLIANRTADTIELTNGISIEVRPANAKTLRGPTYICIVADEIATWFTSVDFENPDVEVLAAIKPGLMTTHGPVLMISSAYAKKGVLFDKYKRYYKPDGPKDILVAYGTSRDLNPSLSEEEIARELELDPIRNRAEYLSEWRSDVEGFIPRGVVEACVGAHVELPYQSGISYFCFVDAASGVPDGDSYTCCIAHRVGREVIIDAIREIRPPFSPAVVVSDTIIPLARSYHCWKVFGDNYSGNFAQEPFRNVGVTYELWPKHTSDIYRDPFLPLLNSKLIKLPSTNI